MESKKYLIQISDFRFQNLKKIFNDFKLLQFSIWLLEFIMNDQQERILFVVEQNELKELENSLKTSNAGLHVWFQFCYQQISFL